MISAPLTPQRVRELTAHCRPAAKPQSNAGRPVILTEEALQNAERMIYRDGATYKEAAIAAGCSISRLYSVLAERRRGKGAAHA